MIKQAFSTGSRVLGVHGVARVVGIAVALGLVAAPQALAAPEFEVSNKAPFALAPGSDETPPIPGTQTINVRNTGDVATSGPVTVTDTLPPELVAVSAVSDGWSCGISGDGQVVTCGGATIPAGSDQCDFFGLFTIPCPIVVKVRARPGFDGPVTTTVEACGGGAVSCASAAAVTRIQTFGEGFGLAPINDEPAAQAAPALPGATHAFWAGTCDTFAAPALGAAVNGGIGDYTATVLAPDFGPPLQSFNQSSVAAPSKPAHCIEWGAPAPLNDAKLWNQAPSWRLPADARAGGHPDGTATFAFAKSGGGANGSVDNISVDLPPGFVGDPTAVPKCSAELFSATPSRCPAASQVGVLHLQTYAAPTSPSNLSIFQDERVHPVWNLEPRKGNAAELGFAYATSESAVSVRLTAKARTNGDFGVTTFIGQIPAALPVLSQQITLWGVPWATSHDPWRASDTFGPNPRTEDPCNAQPGTAPNTTHYIPPAGFSTPGCAVSYDPSWGPIRPFISNVTECTGADLSTRVVMDSYQDPASFTSEGDPDLSSANWKRYESPAPPMTGCPDVPFSPAASFTPTSTAPDSASGLTADIVIPQNDDPPAEVATDPDDETGAPAHWKSNAGLATSHLDKTVVRLPAGLTVNPSAAAGLVGCSDAQMGVRQDGNPKLFNNTEPTCPDGSKIGVAEATTPLLEGSPNLAGEVYLGTPRSTDPQSGEMLRMFLVLRNKDRGLLAKIYGSAVADPATGSLTATFDKNPRVPVENIVVRFKGGARGILGMPQSCGEKATSSEFTPWTAAHGGGGPVRDLSDSFTVGGDCSFGFPPKLNSGMSTRAARGMGVFSFKFSREDGEQRIGGLTAELPTGLLASVKDLPLCASAQAAAGACPEGSRIGSVDATAGSGTPFVLERKGTVYLTEGYKGCAYGLVVVVPVVAGPFDATTPATDLGSIVVRQRVCVDRADASVTAVSDPLPTIHHGIPLRVRSVTVNVDRAGFMLNPSDCDAKQIAASLTSTQGTTANLATGFQAAGCSKLAFKPTLALQLTGRKQVKTGKHPGIKAVVTQQGVPEAGIEKAVVRLPKSLALDVDNAQALCEYTDGIKPDIENHCPKGSIVGRARAVSPLLNDPLVGNVYFVKNVRIDPKTGNQIRTLPMIVVALRGEIAVNLKGESDTTRAGKLVNTFANVPDAPISQFNLNINGGSKGIIVVTRTWRSLINLCASGRQIAEADMDGQNGRRHDFDISMRKPCTKAQTKAAKRKAKRAAATHGLARKLAG